MEYFCAKNLVKTFYENKTGKPPLSIKVSFECEKESFTCIVGPSGSGKSTILRMITGLEKGENSKIFLDNKDISSLPSSKRDIGMVFQSSALFDHLTVQDNVAYGLVSKGMKRKDARLRAREFLSSFNMEDFALRFPDTLSGGEAQRVALARTLITNPKLILLDEPLSALDSPLRKKLADFIKELQKKYKFTAIMVTHDLEEAKHIADNIILIKKGTIYWQGNSSNFTENLMQD